MHYLRDLSTPALIIDQPALAFNLATMADLHPGVTLRPHVKAHKCTSLAHQQSALGHYAFTCATSREVIGMAGAGLGRDLLLANETVDEGRLADMAALQDQARITVAVDSRLTIDAAAKAGIAHVLIDVNVGLPRCGCSPTDARDLAALAKSRGLIVRGVMGYEGHLMTVADRTEQRHKVRESMSILVQSFDEIQQISGVDCTIISAGGTGTFDVFDATDSVLSRINEVQAGSYALMDTHYGALDLPFEQALFVIGTVISVSDGWAVIDVGLKSLGMDHGNPSIDGATVWFCSDEHTTFSMKGDAALPTVGTRIFVRPAHVDPTVSQHQNMYLVDEATLNGAVLEIWPVDLRGW